jgi:hypothetical protein
MNPLYGLNQPQGPMGQGAGQVPAPPMGQGAGQVPAPPQQQRPQAAQQAGGAVWKELAKIIMGGS